MLYNFDYVKALHTENLRHQWLLDKERKKIAMDYRVEKAKKRLKDGMAVNFN